MISDPDGHRCVYAHREGTGPRGGRRTWTVATCVACGATAEACDRSPGSDSTWEARARLREAVPRCPVPIEPQPAERALRALVGAAKSGDPAFPPLAWAVEFMPDGGDIDAAIQRAWSACENVQAMYETLRALGLGGGFLRASSGDEVGQREYIAFEGDGLGVDLQGESGAVCRALRLHFPRLAWEKAGTR